MTGPRFPLLLASAAFIALSTLLILSVRSWSERIEFARLDDLSERQLDLYAAALSSELRHYADMPSLLAIDKDVQATLLAAGNRNTHASRTQAAAAQRISPDKKAALNNTLARFAVHAGLSKLALISRDGRVLASNHASDTSHAAAAAAEEAHVRACFNAVDTPAHGILRNRTSGEPEYFFTHTAQACAVAVINLAPVESSWVDFSFHKDSEKALVLDSNAIVMLSSVPAWRNKAAPVLLDRDGWKSSSIAAQPAEPLAIASQGTAGRSTQLIALTATANARPASYAVYQRSLNSGLHLVLLANPTKARQAVREAQLAAAAGMACLGLLIVYLYHRSRLLHQLVRARGALQATHDQLENTVADRTAELKHTNLELRHQIHEREQAEQALLQAQKLAVLGQMSARLAHELSQPLTALRALARNTRVFLERHQHQRAEQTLQTLAALLERMGRMTAQLKLFAGSARARPLRHTQIELGSLVRNARALLDERFRLEQVLLCAPARQVWLRGDSAQLEQVLVNLFTNAMDAMHQTATQRRIDVGVRHLPDTRVEICVRDTGPGIDTQMRTHLFEPFASSKPSGEGLGLGLVICAGIVREHGGRLMALPANTAAQHDAAGGAAFVFDLPTD